MRGERESVLMWTRRMRALASRTLKRLADALAVDDPLAELRARYPDAPDHWLALLQAQDVASAPGSQAPKHQTEHGMSAKRAADSSTRVATAARSDGATLRFSTPPETAPTPSAAWPVLPRSERYSTADYPARRREHKSKLRFAASPETHADAPARYVTQTTPPRPGPRFDAFATHRDIAAMRRDAPQAVSAHDRTSPRLAEAPDDPWRQTGVADRPATTRGDSGRYVASSLPQPKGTRAAKDDAPRIVPEPAAWIDVEDDSARWPELGMLALEPEGQVAAPDRARILALISDQESR